MGRMQLRRKAGVVAIPGVESLEGRRLLTAAYGGVHMREFPIGPAVELVIVGSPRADSIHVEDNGTGSPGNITVTMGNGASYTSKRAISQVVIQGKGGNDKVTYDLTGDLISARTVLADLGAGSDQFVSNIRGSIDTQNLLDLEAYGESGNDTMTINQTGASLAGVFFPYLEGDGGNDVLAYHGTGNISDGATVGPGMSGGSGNDTITVDYTGVIQGKYQHNLTIDGGPGNDVLTNAVNALAGSSGAIGSDSTTQSVVQGGDGNDSITYAVYVDPTATAVQVYGTASGDSGVDTIHRTKNITGSATNESDGILS